MAVLPVCRIIYFFAFDAEGIITPGKCDAAKRREVDLSITGVYHCERKGIGAASPDNHGIMSGEVRPIFCAIAKNTPKHTRFPAFDPHGCRFTFETYLFGEIRELRCVLPIACLRTQEKNQ